MKKNGFATILILILLIFVAVGVVYFARVKNRSVTKLAPSSLNVKNYDGHYENCQFKDVCNYIDIKTFPDGKVSVGGQAYWKGSETVNTGSILGSIVVKDQKAYFEDQRCKIDMVFDIGKISLQEKPDSSCGGLNVSFDGTYIKK